VFVLVILQFSDDACSVQQFQTFSFDTQLDPN